MSFSIGNIKFKNPVVLAPMAGVSNPAYIKICEEMGVSYAITELISAEGIVRDNKKTKDMLIGFDKINIPIAVQLFGSNEKTLAQAAIILQKEYNVKIIDINMGCPVPKVAIKSEAGSGLLKNPQKIKEIVSAVVKAVSIPVTVKIRSGWDENSINASEVAKICEQAGAKAITIHGRTRKAGYSGKVDLDIIKQVKESVKIPVIGNGDIIDIESAIHMLEYTKVDAIMIGRGSLGNPWLIRDIVTYLEKGIKLPPPTYQDRIKMCQKHLDYLLQFKEERLAILEMRSHIAWYLKKIPHSQEIKNVCFKAKSKEELKIILNNYLKEIENSI